MRHVAAWIFAAYLALAGTAQAQSGVQERAVARGLFDQARALVQQGRYSEACPKLEESHRLDPGIGTQFNLGDCYEHIGRAASAWSLYLEVASAARASGQTDREAVARERARAIEPKVSKLVVLVPEGRRVDRMTIKVDGMTLGQGMWGASLPMDAAEHRVEVAAPGKKTWMTTIVVSGEGQTTTLEVPLLESDSAAGLAAPATTGTSSSPRPATAMPASPVATRMPATAGESSWSTQKTLAVVVAGAGLVGLGASGLIVLGAKSNYDDSGANCSGNYCNDEGLSLREDARTKGNLATVVGSLGLVALGTGAVLFFTAPRGNSGAKDRTTAKVGLGPGWVAYGGRF